MSSEETEAERSEGFLNRWSSRKQQVSDELQSSTLSTSKVPTSNVLAPEVLTSEELLAEDALAAEVLTAEVLTDHPERGEQSPAPEDIVEVESTSGAEITLLSDEDMPEIKTLTSTSDISDFFNEGVSASLRRAALRHIFSLPVYNIRDGLNDYDDDFTRFEPLGETITADMKWHEARKQRALEEEAAREAEEAALAKSEQLEAEVVDEDVEPCDDSEDPSGHDHSSSEHEITHHESPDESTHESTQEPLAEAQLAEAEEST